MKKIKIYIVFTLCFILSSSFTGCENKDAQILDANSPTVVTLWHSYNSYAKTTFDHLILEFNETVGMEKGIIIDAYGYGDATKLQEAVFNSANKIIGAAHLPDIFMAYPDSAYDIDRITPLVELDQYFTEAELGEYREEFLNEGRWKGNRSPKMIPVAKSTEILYVNKTDWDKFAKELGVGDEALQTWEGLAEAGKKYYKWSGGKALLGFNTSNDFVALTAAQLGSAPYREVQGKMTLEYSKEVAKKVWDICYIPHIEGWYASELFNQDGIKSGDLLAHLGSSAGAGYFPQEVILSADESYPIECSVLPYPTFENAPHYMSQRGANMSITSSDKMHEYAAAEFLKWFTAPEQNERFTTSIGYIPVRNVSLAALPNILKNNMELEDNQTIKDSVSMTMSLLQQQEFITKESFDNSYHANQILYKSIFDKISMDLQEIDARVEKGENRNKVISEMKEQRNFDKWYENLTQKLSEQMQ